MYSTKTKPRKHNTSEILFSQKFGALDFRLCDKLTKKQRKRLLYIFSLFLKKTFKFLVAKK